MTWGYADVEDRVASALVCARWREVSLASPAVWSHIDAYSSVHNEHCQCVVCGTGEVVGRHNLGAVQLALSRSADISLSLMLVNEALDSDSRFLDELVRLLTPHIARLAHLQVNFKDAYVLGDFLSKFDCLPVLRSIRTKALPELGDYECPTAIPHNINLPLLQHLDVAHPVDVLYDLRGNVDITFASLTVLECGFFCAAHVLHVLLACPHLSRLHFRISQEFPETFEIDSQLQRPVDRIPHVRMSNLPLEAEAWALQHFGIDCRNDLQWDYDEEAPDVGWQLLQRLAQPIRIDCTLSSDRITLACRDDQKQILISFPFAADCLQCLWQHVPASSVVELVVDAAAWPAVLQYLEEDVGIVSLTVRIGAAADFLAVLSQVGAAHLSRVASLRLQNTRATVFLSLASIVVFIESLCLRTLLDTLQLDGVLIRTPGDALVRRITSAGHELLASHCLRLVGA